MDDDEGLLDLLLKGGRKVGRFLMDVANQPVPLPGEPGFPTNEELAQTAGEFSIPGDIQAIRDIPGLLSEGHPFLAAASLATVLPGIPPLSRIFKDVPKGARVFARSSTEFSVPSRRVVVVTPNTIPGEGPFRASILEETRTGIKARGHVHGGSEAELVEVIEGKVKTGDLAERAERAGIVDLPEIQVRSERSMELSVERNAERELSRLAGEAAESGRRGESTGLMQKLSEGRKLPGGVGGFFFP